MINTDLSTVSMPSLPVADEKPEISQEITGLKEAITNIDPSLGMEKKYVFLSGVKRQKISLQKLEKPNQMNIGFLVMQGTGDLQSRQAASI